MLKMLFQTWTAIRGCRRSCCIEYCLDEEERSNVTNSGFFVAVIDGLASFTLLSC